MLGRFILWVNDIYLLLRNSIGPVLALWSIYQSASVEMKEAPSPLIIGTVDLVIFDFIF